MLDELVATEANYVADLRCATSAFSQPLADLLSSGQHHGDVISSLPRMVGHMHMLSAQLQPQPPMRPPAPAEWPGLQSCPVSPAASPDASHTRLCSENPGTMPYLAACPSCSGCMMSSRQAWVRRRRLAAVMRSTAASPSAAHSSRLVT